MNVPCIASNSAVATVLYSLYFRYSISEENDPPWGDFLVFDNELQKTLSISWPFLRGSESYTGKACQHFFLLSAYNSFPG